MASLVLTSVAKNSTTVDLTALSATDWAHWVSPSTTPSQRKSGGGSLISAAVYGSGNANDYANDPRTITWSDGTPTASGTDTAGVYNDAFVVNTGWTWTFPADTTTRIARIYPTYGYGDAYVLAHISDSSTGDQTDTTTLTSPGAASQPAVIVVTYAAASASQTMTLSVYIGGNVLDFPNVAMQAASVEDAAAGIKGPLIGGHLINGGALLGRLVR